MKTEWPQYELIDFGNGKKLERFNSVILIRPESMARQTPRHNQVHWQHLAHAEFVEGPSPTSGRWHSFRKHPEQWQIALPGPDGLQAKLSIGAYKHVGIFPEQHSHWNYLNSAIKPGMRVLNLFAYTGVASVVAKNAGADVVHVEALRPLISHARENMELSGLDGIRWIHDDAFKFVQRSARRGDDYDVIIADPPAYGRGPKGERWVLEQQLDEFLHLLRKISAPGGMVILNTYSPKITFEQKQRIIQAAGFDKSTTKTGWLSLEAGDKRKLNMSRYAICAV